MDERKTKRDVQNHIKIKKDGRNKHAMPCQAAPRAQRYLLNEILITHHPTEAEKADRRSAWYNLRGSINKLRLACIITFLFVFF